MSLKLTFLAFKKCCTSCPNKGGGRGKFLIKSKRTAVFFRETIPYFITSFPLKISFRRWGHCGRGGSMKICNIGSLAPERGKIWYVGGVGRRISILSKHKSFCFRSLLYQLNRCVVKPADESLMAFANCRQLTQHHSQASSLLKGS